MAEESSQEKALKKIRGKPGGFAEQAIGSGLNDGLFAVSGQDKSKNKSNVTSLPLVACQVVKTEERTINNFEPAEREVTILSDQDINKNKSKITKHPLPRVVKIEERMVKTED